MKTFLKILVLPYVVLFACSGAMIICTSKMFDDFVDEVFGNFIWRFRIWFNILFWSFYVPGSGYYSRKNYIPKNERCHGTLHGSSDFEWYWKTPRKTKRWLGADSWSFINVR